MAVSYTHLDVYKRQDLKSITVVRMEVPCCGGIEFAVKNALNASGKEIPLNVVTISTCLLYTSRCV